MRMRIETKTFIDKALQAAKATFDWAGAGFPLADETDLSKRKAICDACEHWNADAFLGKGKCKVCGCSGVKLNLKTSTCPLLKW